MQLQFSDELIILLHKDNQKQLGEWILKNTKTGQHLMQVYNTSMTMKVIKSEKVSPLMEDLKHIGLILPVLLKLRLLP